MEFESFGKIPRLNRDVIITEKIDGTNAAVIIERHEFGFASGGDYPEGTICGYPSEEMDGDLPRWEYTVGAQSRKRLITPGKDTDNFGFAQWVLLNAEALIALLGEGRHFGEWWGSGVARGYGLERGDRRFSLFNTERYADLDLDAAGDINVGLVPVLYRGPFRPDPNDEPDPVREALWGLKWTGSDAAPGFMNPEGIIVYHTAARQPFKVTLEHDEAPKGSIHWGNDGV